MLLVFDWDGTLIDSTAKIASCIREAADDLGLITPGVDEAKSIIGLGLREAVCTLFPAMADDDEAIAEFCQRYSERFVIADQQPCQFFSGVLAQLEQFRSDGHCLAVATGKSRRGLNRVFESTGVAHLFDYSRCADETESKPSPLMLQQLLSESGFLSAHALMVGDTSFDIDMASRMEMTSVAVSYGAHSLERLMDSSPDHIVDGFDALVPIVAEFSRRIRQ